MSNHLWEGTAERGKGEVTVSKLTKPRHAFQGKRRKGDKSGKVEEIRKQRNQRNRKQKKTRKDIDYAMGAGVDGEVRRKLSKNLGKVMKS